MGKYWIFHFELTLHSKTEPNAQIWKHNASTKENMRWYTRTKNAFIQNKQQYTTFYLFNSMVWY